MGDTVIVTEDEKPAKPAPQIVIVNPETPPKTEKIVTEKTTVIETKVE